MINTQTLREDGDTQPTRFTRPPLLDAGPRQHARVEAD